MRNIKFRGLRTDGKGWIYGDLRQSRESVYVSNSKNALILILPETVGEFTGLSDKNGKTYCQNDIVNYDGKNYRLIKGTYKFELVGFYLSYQDIPTDFFSENAYSKAEIIGNIHENPELLNPLNK